MVIQLTDYSLFWSSAKKTRIFVEFSLRLRQPACYAVGMDKHIRRTVTITLTETWTFVWAASDAARDQGVTVVQQPAQQQPAKAKEENDEHLPTTVVPVNPTQSSTSESTAITSLPDQVVQTTATTWRGRPKRSRRVESAK